MVVRVLKMGFIDGPHITTTPRLPWCAPYAAIFILKGPKTKDRKVPRVLHVAVSTEGSQLERSIRCSLHTKRCYINKRWTSARLAQSSGSFVMSTFQEP